jgi:hypothetical protein
MTNRNPELYLSIDTQKWNLDVIAVPPNREIPVYPMTWQDELELKNADGLMNGAAMANIVQKRIPAIRNSWNVPEHQWNRLVGALHLATHGENLEMRYECKKCRSINDLIVNASKLIDDHNMPDYSSVNIDGLTINFSPLNYLDLVNMRNRDFRMVKMLLNVNSLTKFDPKQIQKELKSYNDNDSLIKTKRIKSIEYEDQSYTDKFLIKDFLDNANREIQELVSNKVDAINNSTNPNIEIAECPECQHKNSITVNLDPSEDFRFRITRMNDEQIIDTIKMFDKQSAAIREEAMRMSWAMRGGANFIDVLNMSPNERKAVSELIKSNMETTKKSRLPFF